MPHIAGTMFTSCCRSRVVHCSDKIYNAEKGLPLSYTITVTPYQLM